MSKEYKYKNPGKFELIMADKSLEGNVGPTQRELRWFRRRQTDEMRAHLEKLKELLMEKGSRTLIRYVMSSTEKNTGGHR